MKEVREKPYFAYELWRRILLLLGCALAFWLYAHASAEPLVKVTVADIPQMQKNILVKDFVTNEDRELVRMEPMAYLKYLAGHNYFHEERIEQSLFVENMKRVTKGDVPPGWAKRVVVDTSSTSHPTGVWFRASEDPLSAWLPFWPERTRRFFVVVDADGDPMSTVFEMTYYHEPILDLRFGDKLNSRIPDGMVRLNRLWPLLAFLSGLLPYLLLPRNRKLLPLLVYPELKTRTFDFGALLMFVTSFGSPLLVSGSTLNAMGEFLPLTLALWLMAGFAVVLMCLNAWPASLTFMINAERMEIGSYRGLISISFSSLESVAHVVKKTPLAFRIILFLGVLFGSSSLRSISSNQLMTINGSSVHGLRFFKKDPHASEDGKKGTYIDLWPLDGGVQQTIMSGTALIEALDNAAVPWREDSIHVKMLGSMAGGGKAWPRKPLLIPVLIMTTLLVFTMGISMFTGRVQSVEFPVREDVIAAMELRKANPPIIEKRGPLVWGDMEVQKLEPQWHRSIGGTGEERTSTMVMGDGNQIWVGGYTNTGYRRVAPGYLLQMNPLGQIMKEFVYFAPDKDTYIHSLAAPEQSRLLVSGHGVSTTGVRVRRTAFLASLDDSGEALWHIDLEEEKSFGGGVLVDEDGVVFWSGSVDGRAFLKALDWQGRELFSRFHVSDANTCLMHSLLSSQDGLWAVGNIEEEPDDPIKPFVIRYDKEGNTVATIIGNTERENRIHGAFVHEKNLFLTGVHDTPDHRKELYLLCLDENGIVQWERFYDIPDHHVTGKSVAVHPEGDLLVVGDVSDEIGHLCSFILRLDAQGNPVASRELHVPGSKAGTMFAVKLLVDADGSIIVGGHTDRLNALGTRQIVVMGLTLMELETDRHVK